jgi:hypothetical protein
MSLTHLQTEDLKRRVAELEVVVDVLRNALQSQDAELDKMQNTLKAQGEEVEWMKTVYVGLISSWYVLFVGSGISTGSGTRPQDLTSRYDVYLYVTKNSNLIGRGYHIFRKRTCQSKATLSRRIAQPYFLDISLASCVMSHSPQIDDIGPLQRLLSFPKFANNITVLGQLSQHFFRIQGLSCDSDRSCDKT